MDFQKTVRKLSQYYVLLFLEQKKVKKNFLYTYECNLSLD